MTSIRRLAGALAAAVALTAAAPAATAEPPSGSRSGSPDGSAGGAPSGKPCAFHVVGDLTGTTWTGTLYGGPLVAPDGEPISMRCTIHDDNASHTGSVVADESSAPGPGVTALEPRPVSFTTAPDVILYECTEATVGGTTWYYSGVGWDTDPRWGCNLHYDPGPPPVPDVPPAVADAAGEAGCEVRTWFDLVDCAFAAVVDPALCGVLAGLPDVPGVAELGADGDVHVAGELVWDCPPYAGA